MIRLMVVGLSLLIPAWAVAEDDPKLIGLECSSQADCPIAFSCEQVELPCWDVPEPACDCACPDGDEDCECDCGGAADEGDDCTPTTEQRCVHHIQPCSDEVACTVDGFVCEERDACGSSGCACPPCPEGEECPTCDCDGEEEEVACEEGSGEGYCAPAEQYCSTDADCAGDWECLLLGETDCACSSGPDGEEDCDCEEEESEGLCAPPGWVEQVEGGFGVVGDEYLGGAERGPVKGGFDNSQGASEDDDVSRSAACAAGGETLSLFGLGLAFALLRRRR